MSPEKKGDGGGGRREGEEGRGKKGGVGGGDQGGGGAVCNVPDPIASMGAPWGGGLYLVVVFQGWGG